MTDEKPPVVTYHRSHTIEIHGHRYEFTIFRDGRYNFCKDGYCRFDGNQIDYQALLIEKTK